MHERRPSHLAPLVAVLARHQVATASLVTLDLSRLGELHPFPYGFLSFQLRHLVLESKKYK